MVISLVNLLCVVRRFIGTDNFPSATQTIDYSTLWCTVLCKHLLLSVIICIHWAGKVYILINTVYTMNNNKNIFLYRIIIHPVVPHPLRRKCTASILFSSLISRDKTTTWIYRVKYVWNPFKLYAKHSRRVKKPLLQDFRPDFFFSLIAPVVVQIWCTLFKIIF